MSISQPISLELLHNVTRDLAHRMKELSNSSNRCLRPKRSCFDTPRSRWGWLSRLNPEIFDLTPVL